jgi:hypothetical protein
MGYFRTWPFRRKESVSRSLFSSSLEEGSGGREGSEPLSPTSREQQRLASLTSGKADKHGSNSLLFTRLGIMVRTTLQDFEVCCVLASVLARRFAGGFGFGARILQS